MRLVIQRVRRGQVSVDEQVKAQIGPGIVVLVGVGHEDGEVEADFLAQKTATLRIFEDEEGKTNRSLLDIGGQALVVSQFTLYADTRKGRRPSFVNAAAPEPASRLVQRFADQLESHGVPTKMGVFGAYMVVDITNDGPMTIILEKQV